MRGFSKDTIQVLAADPDKAWMLLADGGQTLRSILNEGGDIKAHWMNILPQYAEYQIETSKHIDEILTFGCPDYRLEKLPGLVERVLEDTQTLMLNQVAGLTQAERQQLLNDLPKIKNMVDQLNSLGIPAALDHNDMGDNNVFYRDNQIVFFDWGDANITHPFMSMVVTQRVIAFTLDLDSQNDSLAWVRDAYLEPWTSCATRKELEESYAAIQRLGRLHRALIWYNVFKMLAPDLASEFKDAPAGWMQLYLNFPSDE